MCDAEKSAQAPTEHDHSCFFARSKKKKTKATVFTMAFIINYSLKIIN
jgi:hypothetical protein